jgi:hypothetical protein
MFSSSPREELAPCDGRYESATFHPATITWGEWGGLRRGCWMLDVGCWMFDVARGGGRGGPSKNAPPLPHPLLHRMEEREFGCGVRLLRTTVLKDRAFLTRKQRIKFSSSPREERVGRGLRRGAASKNDPPLPHPLLHRMEERELGGSVRLLRTHPRSSVVSNCFLRMNVFRTALSEL